MKEILFALFLGFTFIPAPGGNVFAQNSRKVIEPNLTTINYPGYEMGQVAAQNLINHLNGTVIIKTANTILLHSELIIRASSKRKK